jgi:hypothetical protein
MDLINSQEFGIALADFLSLTKKEIESITPHITRNFTGNGNLLQVLRSNLSYEGRVV